MKRTFEAWAIKVHRHNDGLDPERILFAGRYCWLPEALKIPPQFEGCRALLFNTRAEARKAAPHLRHKWHFSWGTSVQTASPVKVTVTVEEVE